MERFEKIKPIKKKMYDTSDLERNLLNILLNDRMTLRTILTGIRDEWFTDEKRLFIFQKIKLAHEERKSLISKDTLSYEIEKEMKGNDERIQDYKNEVEKTYRQIPTEKADFIIDKLKEADVAENIKEMLEGSYLDLESGDIEEALAKVKRGFLTFTSKREKKKIVALHKEAENWKLEVIKRKEFPDKYAGIKTGLKKFDILTGGLFPAELTIFFGLSGKGKSTVLKNICSRIRAQGKNVLHVTNEENEFQVQTKYQAMESGIYYSKFKRGEITDAELGEWDIFNEKAKQEAGDIYVLEIQQRQDASVIEQAFYELEQRGIKIDIICIDYMDLMSPIHKAFSENDEQAKVTDDCKQLAVNCNVQVLTCTQAGTDTEKQEKKDNPFLTSSDIFGTKRKAHSANTLVGLVNKTATVNVTEKTIEERQMQKIIFCVPKNRDGPIFSFRQILNTFTARLEEDDEPDPYADKLEKKAVAISEEAIQMEEDMKEQEESSSHKIQSEMKEIAQNIMKKEEGKNKLTSFLDKWKKIEQK